MSGCMLEMPTMIYGVIIVNGFVCYSQQLTAAASTQTRGVWCLVTNVILILTCFIPLVVCTIVRV